MKMTKEEKGKLFAQYYGQDVVRFRDWSIETENGNVTNILNVDLHKENKCYLELKDLSLITDKQAEYIGSIHPAHGHSFNLRRGRLYLESLNSNEFDLCVSDYLRSESFALPYNGFSVKRQVVEGVISVIKQSPVNN